MKKAKKIKENKTSIINIRISVKEKEMIKELANFRKKSVSQYMIDTCLKEWRKIYGYKEI